ncbi:response regulator transcription factor [Paraburkholderia terricola]|uniref:DNA-binding response OmpR family regulator n=1 Tax=Paraburkholderia terricola TaxID=169427 RepID=A0ABU1LQV9_9BURK|nr:response regulator transcription factor [Paraburkholderia terricola]MDR6409123.1 DNA-binding response OmpR family regulator [Paraburkholderia terricola]
MKLAVMTRSATLFGLICRCFEADGAVCHRFADDVAFARAIYRDEYSAILIDADTGISPLRPVLARRACYSDRRAPLIVVGGGHDRAGIARLFDAGADDVVLSPVDSRELTLRVHLALLRVQLQAADSGDRLECGLYRLDRRTCTVHVNGKAVRLTSREFAIAWLLFSHPGEYVSRRQIAGAVWSSSEDIIGRTLEQHIYKLRKKLELNGPWGVHLRTLYAHGYRIEIAEMTDAPLEETEAETETETEVAHADTAFEPMTTAERAEAALACLESMPCSTRAADAPPPRAEVHAADSVVARNAPSWSDSAGVFSASSSVVTKVPYTLWDAFPGMRTRGGT